MKPSDQLREALRWSVVNVPLGADLGVSGAGPGGTGEASGERKSHGGRVGRPQDGRGTPLGDQIRAELRYNIGRPSTPSRDDLFRALALSARRPILDRLYDTLDRYDTRGVKRLYYLSMEFLVGRSLSNNLQNLGLYDAAKRALGEFGHEIEDIEAVEPDPALGNGGLGRLAACFLDSLATLDMPGFGYGLHYEFGLFKQEIRGGYQHERPDHWMSLESPWVIERADESVVVPVYGRIEHIRGRDGTYSPLWTDWRVLIGVPYDFPIVGYGGRTVNYLRLYAARSSDEFDIGIFNEGDYIRAVNAKINSESISKILYPSDDTDAGKELRLLQEYFLVACAVRDIVRRYKMTHEGFDQFTQQVAIQLNDTHPALTIAELMRVLIDEHELDWDTAWVLTRNTCAYTNHTLLPEALETWPVEMVERVLPRHTQILYEINHRFLRQVARRWPQEPERQVRMSLVGESTDAKKSKHFRMANLAIVGSHSVNGVAELHSRLLAETLVPDFAEMWPHLFNNKTNGVTHRRWLLYANPALSAFITQRLGSDDWVMDLDQVRALESQAGDTEAQHEFLRIKRANKARLAEHIESSLGIRVTADALFDVQVKRIHEYKRQLLNIMLVMHEYFRIVDDGVVPAGPRVHIFAGKAAPGYVRAKQIIKLIHSVADVVNNDPRVGDTLKVVFLPNYRVSLAEMIMPAADLSEQISTAGFEASGTGNMKLAMNGALTIGTMDGANVEIAEEVGVDNMYIFGLSAEQVARMHTEKSYDPQSYYAASPNLRRVIDSLATQRFCYGEPALFQPLHDALLPEGDRYFHCADFDAYASTQERVSSDFTNAGEWARKAILNVARTSKFSSDRTIEEYAREIWKLVRVAP